MHMQKVNKEFRLFISSTFNDFTAEREVLHRDIFPSIKDKCEEEGYSFIPVDLRWGVTEEAGLDQRTLQICLDEVKSCKSAPKPNFLIMVGDRYGWVPLPYSIRQEELEGMLQVASDEDREAIYEWYKLDLNNVPPSYRLEQRTGKYIDSVEWNKQENELRKILQDLAEKYFTDKESDTYKKYFTSATEAEIINGINSKGGQIDKEAVFGYLRNVTSNTNNADTDHLKTRLKNELSELDILVENLNECPENSTQVSKAFKDNIKQFLESRIDQQIAEDKEKEDITSDQDLHDQFAHSKTQILIGQDSVLHDIEGYLASDLTSPFLLTGLSGSGKSVVMAKAYLNAGASGDDVIVASRFIGGASGAFSIEQFCASFIEQLGDDDAKQAIKEIQEISLSSQEKSERIQAKFCDFLKQDRSLWLFVDSLDQLPGEPSLDWLPETLGRGVKVVVSALNDESYRLASEYFELLEKRLPAQVITTINPFSEEDCKALLNALLTNEKRTLQDNQFEYVLEKCNQVQTPLYVAVAVQEVKFWRSFDGFGVDGVSLQASRRGVVLEFIQNLYLSHHNHLEMVFRALSFIGAYDPSTETTSYKGVAESEIITLLNLDANFIEKVAPSTYHLKVVNEIPISIWVRLRNGIMPFIRSDQSDGKTRYSFIHREFYAAVQSLPMFAAIIDTSIVRLHRKLDETDGYLRLRNHLINFRFNTVPKSDLASALAGHEESTLNFYEWENLLLLGGDEDISLDVKAFKADEINEGVLWLLRTAAKESYFVDPDRFVQPSEVESAQLPSRGGENIFELQESFLDISPVLETWHPLLILDHWANYHGGVFNKDGEPIYHSLPFIGFLRDYLGPAYEFKFYEYDGISYRDAETIDLYLQYLAGIAILQFHDEKRIDDAQQLAEVNDLISKIDDKDVVHFMADGRYPGVAIVARFTEWYYWVFRDSQPYEKASKVYTSITQPLLSLESEVYQFENSTSVEGLLEEYYKRPSGYESVKGLLKHIQDAHEDLSEDVSNALLELERYAYLKGLNNEWINEVKQRSSNRYDFWRQVGELLESETFYGARWVSSLDEEFLADIHRVTGDSELAHSLVKILVLFLEEPFERLPIYRLALGFYDDLVDVLPDAKLADYKASGIKDFQQKNFKENFDLIRYSLGDTNSYSDVDERDRVWAVDTKLFGFYFKEGLLNDLIERSDELYKSFKAFMDNQLLPDSRFEVNLGLMPFIVGLNEEPEFDLDNDPEPILMVLLYLHYLESGWFKDADEQRWYFDELVERLKESDLDFYERHKAFLEKLLLPTVH